ncbi:DUF4383 domain-containing protein [Mycolicibacterium phlei]|uniref:DUF4383 domain-containing protein n=1 Tax=Mycolicibacterium phlei TaxID=1771 RepID=UPI0037C9CE33
MARPKIMAVQGAAVIAGAALIVLGVVGFIVAAPPVYSVTHILVGVLGLLLARTYAWARSYLLFGGAVYFALWTHAMVTARVWDWLLMGLGVTLVLLAVTLAGRRDPTKRHRRGRRIRA